MCTLRAYGKEFDVDRFLARSPWRPSAVHHRGINRHGRNIRTSGFNLTVSNASWDNLKRQIKGALQFINRHKNELRRLRSFKGIHSMELDFPLNQRDEAHGVIIPTAALPLELIQKASAAGLSIEISMYASTKRRRN